MKPQYEEAKALVESLAGGWQQRLGLDWVRIEYVYIETFHDDGPQVVADTECYWEYHTAKMRWYMPAVIRQTPDEIEADLIHELVHILVNPMERHVADRYTEQKEFAVEAVTQAILSVSRTNA